MKYLNYVGIVIASGLLLVGCSGESSKTSSEPAVAITEDVTSEQQKEEKMEELPNVMDDILGWDFNAFKELWGKTEELSFDGGASYQFEKIPDVTITLDEYDIISAVIINNPQMDVYGSKVGQTAAEVKQAMDEYGFELLIEGEDEMDGGWILEYQIDSNKTAMYFSEGEEEPVAGILVKLMDTYSETIEDSNASNEGTGSQMGGQAAQLSAYWATVAQSGSRQIPVIEVINEGQTNASQISVRAKVYYSNERGNSSSTIVYGQLSYVGAGQVGQVQLLGGAAYSVDDVEILEVKGVAQ